MEHHVAKKGQGVSLGHQLGEHPGKRRGADFGQILQGQALGQRQTVTRAGQLLQLPTQCRGQQGQGGVGRAGQLREGHGRVVAIGRPRLPRQLAHRLVDRPTLGPQPRQYLRRQLADTDKALYAGYVVDFDQLQPGGRMVKTCQGTDQKQLVIAIGFAPQHAVIGAAQFLEMGVFIVQAARGICHVQGKRLADETRPRRPVGLGGQGLDRAHAQRIAEHPEAPLEPGHAKAVGNIIAATPMGGARFITGLEAWVAGGEVHRIHMGLEFWPTAETQLSGNQPLSIGQGRRRVGNLRQFIGRRALFHTL